MCFLKILIWKISQNSRENSWARVPILLKLHESGLPLTKNETLTTQVFSYEFCEILRNTFLTQQLPVTASGPIFMFPIWLICFFQGIFHLLRTQNFPKNKHFLQGVGNAGRTQNLVWNSKRLSYSIQEEKIIYFNFLNLGLPLLDYIRWYLSNVSSYVWFIRSQRFSQTKLVTL